MKGHSESSRGLNLPAQTRFARQELSEALR
jgi:hypothetical protein